MPTVSDMALRTSVLLAGQLADAFIVVCQEGLASSAQVLARATLETTTRAAYLAIFHDLPRARLDDRVRLRAKWGDEQLTALGHAGPSGGKPGAGIPEMGEAIKQIRTKHPDIAEQLTLAARILYDEASEVVHGSPYAGYKGLAHMADPNEVADTIGMCTMILCLAFEGLLQAMARQPHFTGESRLTERLAWASRRISLLSAQTSEKVP
jgi:hypothetical protein